MILFVYLQLKDFSIAKNDELILFGAINNYLFHNGSPEFWLSHPPYSAFWAPVPIAFMVLLVKISGFNYAAMHLGTLCLHILCVLTLFTVLKMATRSPWRSFFVAALFAVHPLNVETVASLHLCVYTISTLFYLLALGVYISGRTQPGPKWYLVIFALWTAGLLSHPATLHLPVIFLAMDFWLQNGQRPGVARAEDVSAPSVRWHPRIMPKLPFFAFCLLWVLIAMGFACSTTSAAPGTSPSVQIRYLPLAFVSWLHYLQAIAIRPFPLPRADEGTVLFAGPYPWTDIGMACLVLMLISMAVFHLGKKHRYLPTGWIWFIISLVPFIAMHFNKHNILDYRYAYLPAIGIFIMISWGWTALTSRLRHHEIIAPVLAAILLASLMVSARQQVRHWKNIDAYVDFTTVGLSAIEKSRYYGKYGEILSAQGNPAEAIARFRQALTLNPNYIEVHNNIANLLADAGQLEEASTHYQQALKLDPLQYVIHNNLALVLLQVGRRDQALIHLEKALMINPDYRTARENLQRLTATTNAPQPDDNRSSLKTH